jgi:hypothetical protein
MLQGTMYWIPLQRTGMYASLINKESKFLDIKFSSNLSIFIYT